MKCNFILSGVEKVVGVISFSFRTDRYLNERRLEAERKLHC